MVGKRVLHCLAYNLHNYANDVAAIRLQGSPGLLFLCPRSSLKHPTKYRAENAVGNTNRFK